MLPDYRKLLLAVIVVSLLTTASLLLMGRLRSQAQPILATWIEPTLPNTAAGRQFHSHSYKNGSETRSFLLTSL